MLNSCLVSPRLVVIICMGWIFMVNVAGPQPACYRHFCHSWPGIDINITFTWLLHDLTHINMMPKGLWFSTSWWVQALQLNVLLCTGQHTCKSPLLQFPRSDSRSLHNDALADKYYFILFCDPKQECMHLSLILTMIFADQHPSLHTASNNGCSDCSLLLPV
jgi:hypothetical protein